MTSDIALSARPKALDGLVDWHIPGLSRRPASQLPILQLARSNWRILQGMRVSYDPAASNQPRATQSRRMRHVLRRGGNSPGSSRRVIHLRHLGHSQVEARPRRREAFLRLAVVLQRGQAVSTASQPPERAAVRGGDGRRRGRLREGLDAVELVTRPMRGGPVRGSAS
jgi:hypothetical protein